MHEVVTVSDSPRSIAVIAENISRTWPNVSVHARPYLNAMYHLNSVDDLYGVDSARGIITYFLGNAAGWKGVSARLIKQELHDLVRRRANAR
jgi:hypothetical protein